MCLSVSSVLEGREGGGRVGGVRGWVSLSLSPAQSSCLTLRLILGGRLISSYSFHLKGEL